MKETLEIVTYCLVCLFLVLGVIRLISILWKNRPWRKEFITRSDLQEMEDRQFDWLKELTSSYHSNAKTIKKQSKKHKAKINRVYDHLASIDARLKALEILQKAAPTEVRGLHQTSSSKS